MDEFSYVATQNTVWNCVTCGCYVTSEPMEGWQDQQGKSVILYSPSSRYWMPGSKPGLTRGVFCRSECANNAPVTG